MKRYSVITFARLAFVGITAALLLYGGRLWIALPSVPVALGAQPAERTTGVHPGTLQQEEGAQEQEPETKESEEEGSQEQEPETKEPEQGAQEQEPETKEPEQGAQEQEENDLILNNKGIHLNEWSSEGDDEEAQVLESSARIGGRFIEFWAGSDGAEDYVSWLNTRSLAINKWESVGEGEEAHEQRTFSFLDESSLGFYQDEEKIEGNNHDAYYGYDGVQIVRWSSDGEGEDAQVQKNFSFMNDYSLGFYQDEEGIEGSNYDAYYGYDGVVLARWFKDGLERKASLKGTQLNFHSMDEDGTKVPGDVRIGYNGVHVGIGLDTPAGINIDGTVYGESVSTNVLVIRGGADLAEQFELVDNAQATPGLVVAIDPDHPGQLRIADTPYDRTVAGVISGAGGVRSGLVLQQVGALEGTHPVALSGRVYVWADASNGPIVPGDLMTTSAIAGHAMRVTDYTRAQGAIIGKAMTGLEEGTGLVLVLISLQ